MKNTIEIYITEEATDHLVQEEIRMKGYWLPIIVKFDNNTFDTIAVTPECFINGYENEIKSGRLPKLEDEIIVQNLDKSSIINRIV